MKLRINTIMPSLYLLRKHQNVSEKILISEDRILENTGFGVLLVRSIFNHG
jgi:hypothetical protein